MWFYCAYDAKKDKTFALKTNNAGMQSFQPESITPGNYTVKINWSDEEKKYYAEKSLTVL